MTAAARRRRQRDARVAASEIAQIVDVASESSDDSVQAFGQMLCCRIWALLKEGKAVYYETNETLAPYIKAGQRICADMDADRAGNLSESIQ